MLEPTNRYISEGNTVVFSLKRPFIGIYLLLQHVGQTIGGLT